MYRRIRYSFIGVLLISLVSIKCTEPISLDFGAANNFLVVDGFISDEEKKHGIKLSRSANLDNGQSQAERGARVSIEDEMGNVYQLSEQSPGFYASTTTFRGEVGRAYHLNIQTQDQKNYTSLPVQLRKTPAIDSVYALYQRADIGQPSGIYFFVDSQDPQQNTLFYRWEWEETYEILTPFPSIFLWLGGNEVERRGENVGNCWSSNASENILISSTANLSEDRISSFNLHFVSDTSQAMRIKYSLLVRQYSLSEEGFFYWKNLKEQNEDVSGFFSRQPGNLNGNIRSLDDPDEVVLGFFDAAQVSQQRVFFDPRDFTSQGYSPPPYFRSCENRVDTVSQGRLGDFMNTASNKEIKEIWNVADFTINNQAVFLIKPKSCSNCTGFSNNQRPAFWE